MKLVIVGGGAGGPSAATRARRIDEKAEIVLFEKGDYVSYAHCGLPYYTGGVIKKRNDLLVSNPRELKARYNIDVRLHCEVKRIIPEKKCLEIMDLSNNKSYQETYDSLVISPGADPIRLPAISSDLANVFTLRNLSNADVIHEFIRVKQPRRAIVVGGGFIGLEIAENLKNLEMETTIIEMYDQVLPPLDPEIAFTAQQALKANKVGLLLSSEVESIIQNGEETQVRLKGGQVLPFDIMILAVGVRPNVKLAADAGIEIGALGGIKVDEHMQTSIPGIYAVGDAVETKNMVTGKHGLSPLAGPASRQSRIAADNIFGINSRFKGALGTTIIKIFNTALAITGVNEKILKREGISYQVCHVHGFSHADYYPDAALISMKLLFSSEDGRILGAQAAGADGIDKRIDVIATAITAGMTVDDLTDIQLCYAPQFGTGKDIINIAGYVAFNMLHGYAPTIQWNDDNNIYSADSFLIDVRSKPEYEAGAIPGSKNIYVNELRDRLNEIPENKRVYVYCAAGVRSYIGTRILMGNNIDVKNISGGFITYQNMVH
jgi:NADPH-dependent 2,4-dienoyl-CoA reductase/sulfur reductase-like enzyme/rhodanese-related sulfurtransferase